MSKTKATFTKDEIQNVLQWQQQIIEIAVSRGMTAPVLAQLQRNMLWDIARQFDITLADSAPIDTKSSDGVEGKPPLDQRLGAQKETTQGAPG